MRRPDDRRWMDVFSEVWLMPRLRWAVSEATLVLMVEAIANLLKELTEYGVAASRGASTMLASWVPRAAGHLVNGGPLTVR
ncbi:hypothetical protein ACINB_27930 [Acidovorax sp. NB1]|nr:hypothetical protein ACINB_27930 [Acidovorax sp. NB1]